MVKNKDRVKFIWLPVEENLVLPFIQRGSTYFQDSYLTFDVLVTTFKSIFALTTFLLYVPRLRIKATMKEAEAFYDILKNHMVKDRFSTTLYDYTETAELISFNEVKKMFTFANTCRRVLMGEIKENNLFGFIQIGESCLAKQMPFVWINGKQMVPMFYLEGKTDYLDSKSVILTDRWEIAYLKFCCKVLKLNKQHYDKETLNVVDFNYVKRFFPKYTSFGLYSPKQVWEELLAPEAAVALLHGLKSNLEIEKNVDLFELIQDITPEVEKWNHQPVITLADVENALTSEDEIIFDNEEDYSSIAKTDTGSSLIQNPVSKPLKNEFKAPKNSNNQHLRSSKSGNKPIENIPKTRVCKSKPKKAKLFKKAEEMCREAKSRIKVSPLVLKPSASCLNKSLSRNQNTLQHQQKQASFDVSSVSSQFNEVPQVQKKRRRQELHENVCPRKRIHYEKTLPQKSLPKIPRGQMAINQTPRRISAVSTGRTGISQEAALVPRNISNVRNQFYMPPFGEDILQNYSEPDFLDRAERLRNDAERWLIDYGNWLKAQRYYQAAQQTPRSNSRYNYK